MNNDENKNEVSAHEGCGGCGCSATNNSADVEKVESYEEATSRRAYTPAVDIADSKSETVLIMDLPGASEKDVDIAVEKNILTIKASQGEAAYEGKQLVYSEYGTGGYHRSFVLSDDVDVEHIGASMKNGVLTVKLPKSSPVSRKISVGSPS